MKPKTLAIMYGDKIVLGLLGILLFYCFYVGFWSSDPEEEKIGGDIDQRVAAVETLLKKRPPRIHVVAVHRRIADQLARREVVSPHRPAVFFRERIWSYPADRAYSIRLAVPYRIPFPGRITRLIKYDDRYFKDEPAPEAKYDEAESLSRVQFIAENVGETSIVFEDADDRLWRLRLKIQKEPDRRPYPVVELVVKLVKGNAELTCVVVNPPAGKALPEGVAMAEGVNIYRRSASDPDEEASYQKLNTKVVKPARSEEVARPRERPEGPPPKAVRRSRPPGPPRPEDGAPPEGEGEGQQVRHGFLLFADKTVEPGGSYVYKVIAVSAIEPPEESEAVLSTEVLVPRDVLFFFTLGSPGKARFQVQKLDYELARWFRRNFPISEGQWIGDRAAERVYEPGRRRPKSVTVDYQTKCVLVRVVPNAIRYRANVRQRRRHSPDGASSIIVRTVKLQPVKSQKAIYIDRKGRLHAVWRGRATELPKLKARPEVAGTAPDEGADALPRYGR